MQQPKKHFLSQSERDSLIRELKMNRDKRICYRINTILLLDNGIPYKEVAQLLFLGEGTVREYYRVYSNRGMQEFLTLCYSGKPTLLEQHQLDDLKDFVDKSTPGSCLPVVAYIQQKFGITYTVAAVTALLHKLGFTYRKPKLIPGKIDPIAQERFVEELKQLEKTMGEKDYLFYMDGVHPQHNSKPAYGWFKKGEGAVLKANTGRKRININGALNANDFEVTWRLDDTLNAESTLLLFQQIERKYPQANRITIICDNARYYRSKIITEYIKKSKITLKFLPPYSPNLNLIERLWLLMNKKARNNKYYEKFKDFQRAIHDFFEKLPSYRLELQRLFRKKFCVYNF